MNNSWSNPSRSDNPSDPIVRQIDELQRIAQDAKRDALGQDFHANIKDFYALESSSNLGTVSFRPRVDIPALQTFMLAETAELTDNTPVIYITDPKGKRDREREKIMRSQWKQEFYPIKILGAQLWALFAGTGILGVGIDPLAYSGRGKVWAESIDPEFFFPDPVAFDDEDWQFCIYQKSVHLDYLRRLLPDRGWLVPNQPVSKGVTGDNIVSMQMPFGPMEGTSPLPQGKRTGMALPNLRYCYTLDPTPERVKEIAGSNAEGYKNAIAPSKWKLMFPNGRLTIEADGIVLYDGNNPTPHRKFPFIPYFGMPKLQGFWAPPPTRYTRSLQEFAERSMTQGFENAVRCNNGVWLLPDGSGIDADKFGGLPGEIQIYNGNHGEPKFVTPNGFPAQHLEYIKYALQLQSEIQGRSGARSGQPGAGNISAELYENAIEEASQITKLRSRLAAVSTKKAATMIFYLTARYFQKETMFPVFDQDFTMEKWEPMADPLAWNIWLDEGSLEVMSAKGLRKAGLAYKQAGLIDSETALEWQGIPGAKEISEKAQQELALAALAQVKRGKQK